MAQAATDEQWNHTATLLAMLVNVNRDPKKGRAVSPDDFHPRAQRLTRQRRAAPPIKVPLTVLRDVFVKER